MMLLHPKYIKQPPTLKNSKKQEEKILTNKPKKNPITMKLQAMSQKKLSTSKKKNNTIYSHPNPNPSSQIKNSKGDSHPTSTLKTVSHPEKKPKALLFPIL